MRPRLEFSASAKSWHGRTVLHGFALSVGEGESVALLGRHGAGKTTVVMLALGMTTPDQGMVRVLGGSPGRLQARRQTGAMLQRADLPADVRVRSLLSLVRSYYPDPLPLAEAAAAAGLTAQLGVPIAQLVAAERKALQFALALCGRPTLLILDDPVSGLDPAARPAVCASIRQFAEAGGSVLLTASYAEEIGDAAGRICLLGHGAASADTTLGRLRASEINRRPPERFDARSYAMGPREAVLGFTGQGFRRDGAMPDQRAKHADSVNTRSS